MKARMRRMTAIRTMVALALLIVSGFVLAAAREPVSGFGNVTGFVGSATLIIGDDTFQGTVVVAPTAPPELRPSGAIYFPVVEHVFTFAGVGSITTVGTEVAVPTDEPGTYALNGYMRIAAGTEAFEGASGEMSVRGEISNLQTGEASFEMRGAISR